MYTHKYVYVHTHYIFKKFDSLVQYKMDKHMLWLMKQ